MRELNRLAVTSVIDAGGGFQNYPEDYAVFDELHRRGELTVRTAYNLFTQRPGGEVDDFSKWTEMTRPGAGDDYYHVNGAGEMLVFSAADFEDFLQPRPEMPANMEKQLKTVVRLLAEKRWPFRLHATYDETIDRALTVFEEVNREIPFNGLRWFFDHAETISQPNIHRVGALGGGIALQDRMVPDEILEKSGAKAARKAFERVPLARVEQLPDADAIIFGREIISDDAHAPGIEIGSPTKTYRRIRMQSKFGKMTALVTDGHLPYPYGREITGYEVDSLSDVLSKANEAGVTVLVRPYKVDQRNAAMVQFPGGYVAEIHSLVK